MTPVFDMEPRGRPRASNAARGEAGMSVTSDTKSLIVEDGRGGASDVQGAQEVHDVMLKAAVNFREVSDPREFSRNSIIRPWRF